MSRQVQEKILQINRGFPLIWDGNKIAWSSNQLPEQRMTVDLDAEKGRAARPGKSPDTCYVIIRLAKTIRMASIKAYIEKKIAFDNTVLESINFLDHVMRQGPSEYYTQIKRSYFSQGNVSQKLDDVVYAMKGVYSSMRLCNTGSTGTNLATGLGVNVDVANGTFWISQDMHQAARNLCKERNRQLQWNVFRDLLQPIRDPKSGKWKKSEDWKTLQKMSKLRFTVKHRKSNGKWIGYSYLGATTDNRNRK
ncbi:Bgt-1037 [Blumeria graminis f. sp. tritici]|uniref:Eukaryotic translation initiation factor 2C n=2 Tax=Blumeria graminis f. sp. tritici TaxID=62690 RepID=A0A656KHF8_BLUGR|nr:eukaryotic translation initiation factor 2C [Blumeria graminis f. sp. tritici 96224]VDB83834.1 Bgt-1037 [Blumeria graminis f. sp. tritici]